jgi:ketosteroid isomerase-like protein
MPTGVQWLYALVRICYGKSARLRSAFRVRGKETMKLMIALVALAAATSCSPAKEEAPAAPSATAELRAAEARLVAHLQGNDPMAWVGDYTKDAVFQEGDGAPVTGRAELTEVARTLGPLHDTAIEPIRTEIQGNLAYVQVRARYAAGKDQPTWYRGVMIWRKEADGQWRMLHEMLVRERPSRE